MISNRPITVSAITARFAAVRHGLSWRENSGVLRVIALMTCCGTGG
jgi:hypothetical protein